MQSRVTKLERKKEEEFFLARLKLHLNIRRKKRRKKSSCIEKGEKERMEKYG